MEPFGWIIFIVSNAVVIGLVVYCFYKVFTIPQEHMASTLEIDTKDLDENGEPYDDTDKPISGPSNPQSL